MVNESFPDYQEIDGAWRKQAETCNIRVKRVISVRKSKYDGSGTPLPGFTLSGRADSEADNYAQAHGIRFISD